MSREELLIALRLTQHNHRILMKLKGKAKEGEKMNEKEPLIPVSITELAKLEVMASFGHTKTIDFKFVTDEIDKRVEGVGEGLKGQLGLLALIYGIFEMEKNEEEDAAQLLAGEAIAKSPGIAPVLADALDVLEKEWREAK